MIIINMILKVLTGLATVLYAVSPVFGANYTAVRIFKAPIQTYPTTRISAAKPMTSRPLVFPMRVAPNPISRSQTYGTTRISTVPLTSPIQADDKLVIPKPKTTYATAQLLAGFTKENNSRIYMTQDYDNSTTTEFIGYSIPENGYTAEMQKECPDLKKFTLHKDPDAQLFRLSSSQMAEGLPVVQELGWCSPLPGFCNATRPVYVIENQAGLEWFTGDQTFTQKYISENGFKYNEEKGEICFLWD